MTYGFGGSNSPRGTGSPTSSAPSGGTTSANSAGRYGGEGRSSLGGATSSSTAGRMGGSSSNTASKGATSSKSAGGTTSANSAGRYGGEGRSSLGSGSSGSTAGRYGATPDNTARRTATDVDSIRGGGTTTANIGRYGGPTAQASTPAMSAGSGGYGGPSTATGYSPDLSSRTRMGSVTFGGPKAATTTGLDQNAISDRIASAFGTPADTPTYNDANFNARTPTGTTPQQAAIASRINSAFASTPQSTISSRINSAFGTMPQSGQTADIKGLGSPLGIGVSAPDLSPDERRADLAQQARAAENTSMADYASEITGPRAAATADLASKARAAENMSMADLGSLKESYRVAIKGRETEGEDDPYGTVHPGVPQKNGTIAHAIGAYGVMDYNVGPWTKEVLGAPMTVKDFLANPQAQDKVFDAKIGQYVAKTGSFEKAAQAWYGGPGSVGKPNNAPPKGVAGPTVGVYAADAVARQTNAYNSLTAKNRTGTSIATAATDTSSDVESRANAAAVAARESVREAAVAAGEDPQSREVQQRQDAAANDAYDAVKNGTPAPTTAADEPTTTQPAPSQPTTNVSLPQRAPKPTSRDAPAYQRSLPGTVVAGGIDLLSSAVGPIGLAAQLGSLLLGGDSLGGLVADAAGGKFGENYASPERNTPMRGLGSGGDRFATDQPTSTVPKALQSPAATMETPASTFEDKYLGGSGGFDEGGRPTPEQKWDWTSSKYIGVANAPSI